MDRFTRGISAAIIVSIALLAATGNSAWAARDRCRRSAALDPGPTEGAYYVTISPFEHFDSERTQVFPSTCAVGDLGKDLVAARQSPVNFATPYIPFTRNRDELFVYGYGVDAATEGGFVASVDTATLQQRWRTQILATELPNQWSYPGVGLAHGNGFIYAIYANVLVKLDPVTGAIVHKLILPEDLNQTGAAYNGMIVMPDGVIVAKGMERGPCPTLSDGSAAAEAFEGLLCGTTNQLPSVIVTLDPDTLSILQQITPPEPSTGRITAGQTDGHDYVYVAGSSNLFRYVYSAGHLTLDNNWGPVTYRTGAQQPGTGPGILGNYVVIQTNFLPSLEPLSVTAADVRDGNHHFSITPFPKTISSWNVSKMALDADNSMIVTNDTNAGQMAGVHLDPVSGLKIVWSRADTTLDFSALVGPPNNRNIVVPDYNIKNGDHTVWLNEATGKVLLTSRVLSSQPAPGNIVTPGFDGLFYYISAQGNLWELKPHSR